MQFAIFATMRRAGAVRMSLWWYTITLAAFPAIVLVMARGDLRLACGLRWFWRLCPVALVLVPPAVLVPLWAVLAVWAWAATRRPAAA